MTIAEQRLRDKRASQFATVRRALRKETPLTAAPSDFDQLLKQLDEKTRGD